MARNGIESINQPSFLQNQKDYYKGVMFCVIIALQR